MGVRDIPFWTKVAGQLADMGVDRLGARKCATKGHKWVDVKALVTREDGSVELLEKGAAQRCVRCGAERSMMGA